MKAPLGIVSIHDVEPATLDRVEGLVDRTEEADVRPPTLLVVPGVGWDADGLARLRALVARGCTLAGHGWEHRAPPPATLKHRLHAWIISRDQAEHLSRPRAELLERVRRCHAWFADHDLPEPELYVPPAWALGELRTRDLADLPFRWYEDLTGFVDAATGRRTFLPLVGFEADTRFRRVALRVVNAVGVGAGRILGRPVRVSIHPRDLELLLAEDLRALLGRPWRWVGEARAVGALPGRAPVPGD